MRKKRKNFFSLVELVVVIGIILILAGMLLPMLKNSRDQAKYTRWQAFNAGMDRDSDAVFNFSFEETDFLLNGEPALRNQATGCSEPNYLASKYDGLLKSGDGGPLPKWTSGRWKNKKALRFSPSNQNYIQIPGTKTIDFNPEKDSFSLVMWVYFFDFNSNYTLFSKADSSNVQYELYSGSNSFTSETGGNSVNWTQANNMPIKAKKWLNLALVNDNGSCKVYCDGHLLTSSGATNSGPTTSSAELILGAFGNGTQLNFYGVMDEAAMFLKPLSKGEIDAYYNMGSPY